MWKPGLPGIEPEQPDSSTRTTCSETPAVAEGHVPAPSHGLHNDSTQPARVRRGSTGLKVEDNSQVCANSLEFYIEANII